MTAVHAAGWLVLGAAIGAAASWAFPEWYSPGRAAGDSDTLAQRAALAHAIYAPEVRHPVEVRADQESHLIAWLSKRLRAELRVPNLSTEGFALVGGRLLPGDSPSPEFALPAAQFMYENPDGRRITVYVRNAALHDRRDLRYARQRGISIFHWSDGALAYALASSDISRGELRRLAKSVQRQGKR